MLLNEIIKNFLDSRKRGTGTARTKCSPKTVSIYEDNLQLWERWLLEQSATTKNIVSYEQVTRRDMSAFMDWLDAKVAKKEWSNATRLQILRTLRAMFRWIEADPECKDEELNGKKHLAYLPKISNNPRRTNIPTTRDLKDLLAAFDTSRATQFRDFVIVKLICDNGLRIGEVCNMKLNHLRLDERILIVYGKKREGGEQAPRPVPISTEMGKLLTTWLRRRARLYKCVRDGRSDYVFPGRYSGQISPHTWAKGLRKFLGKHGMQLGKITAHTIRHAFATNFLRKNGDMEKLRIILGHESYAMTKQYAHLAELGTDSLKGEVDRVTLLNDV